MCGRDKSQSRHAVVEPPQSRLIDHGRTWRLRHVLINDCPRSVVSALAGMVEQNKTCALYSENQRQHYETCNINNIIVMNTNDNLYE